VPTKVPFWRTEDPELDPSFEYELGMPPKILRGGMWPYQRTWWNLPNFMKALVTGYGGGKTLTGAKRAIALALENGQRDTTDTICPVLAVFPTYSIARRTGMIALKTLLSGKESLLGKKGFRWSYNSGTSEFNIYYRGRHGVIWIASGDNPTSLKGPNVGAAWVDEPFIQDEMVLDVVLSRVRDPHAVKQEIVLTGTPEELNWGYDICEGTRKDDFDIGLVQSSSAENIALGKAFTDRLKRGYTEQAVKAFVEGQFVNLQSGRVYYGFSDKNIRDLPDPGLELILGLDFNVNPMAGVVFWHDPETKHLHVKDEIELENADTDYFMGYLKENYSVVLPEGGRVCRIRKIYPDASGARRTTNSAGGRSDFTIIKEHGFEIEAPRSNPMVRDRENAVNGKFAPASGESTLTVSPRCRQLISYLRKYTHENRGNATGRGMSHLIDAFGYPVHRLYPIERIRFYTTNLAGT